MHVVFKGVFGCVNMVKTEEEGDGLFFGLEGRKKETKEVCMRVFFVYVCEGKRLVNNVLLN